jgi:hypothetical protein
MRIPKDKYKYEALISGRKKREAFVRDLATVRSRKLHGICNTFAVNTGRMSALSLAMAEIAYQIRRDQWCLDYAMFETEREVKPPFTIFQPSEKVRAEYAIQLDKCIAMSVSQQSGLRANWGADSIRYMLLFTPGMDSAMEALLSSVVIGSWIAFETLASDLWVAALDYGPAIVRQRVWQKNPKTDKSDDPLDATPPEELGFDPKNIRKLGSAYHKARKVSFRRLHLIIRNYEIAFTSKIKTHFRTGQGKYITALSAYRNALIHNGGKADSIFVKQVKDLPEFGGIKAKQKLKLDGELVAKLRTASTELGADLIHFVDDLLTKKP